MGVARAGLSFDGIDDLVTSDPIPALPTEAADPWSMNMWVQVDQEPEELTILGGFGDVTSARPIGCQRYLVKMRGGIHFWGSSVDVNAGVPFDLGKWQMITITYDGARLTIHKDGKALVSSQEKLTDAASLVRLAPLDHWGKDNRFAGQIDELTIWRGALTQEQIRALAGKLGPKKKAGK